ncbi:hypothetical protein BDP27DRAFT_1219240 [Rhodocollybia butyracea]|uniref:CxC2-like cysteine cluster KDZ transposase-associated domain-containing protein n=1 Tax=Rhodocollybia butyracea TaxID=206335 RepID=A0A9P5UAP7_9AGAR|nr:hypothetical protein BDP27DRAFT_1219240 [Rhodocollybia butyracea]
MNGDFHTKILELWHRDPLECVAEILANPAFKDHQVYIFQQQRDGVLLNREYNEMWTADWWWDTQDKLPDGATIAPIILASDETQLLNFSGDKKAWPVYLTIGNVAKAERRKPSSRAWVLLGYIPVSKLECYSEEKQSDAGCQLFHDCMRKILEPLITKGLNPTEMACADGFLRRLHAILAAYIANYPEQCQIACCRENSCPKCIVGPKEWGNAGPLHSVYRDPKVIVKAIAKKLQGQQPATFKDQNLCLINPFWKDLPLCNIFECITPDLLHQLQKGVFSDHVSSWAKQSIKDGKQEIDVRYQTMPAHPTLRHFKKGISGVLQWTGGEYRSMAKVFLSTLADAAEPGVIHAVAALDDFMYYAHFESHCDETLQAMHSAWQTFHLKKSIFIDLGIRQHFNISKVHNIKHYVESICSQGTTDNFNSKMSERLHIDLAKAGYCASNKQNYMVQMKIWLQRQEAVQQFAAYLEWAVKDYVAQSIDDNEDEEEEEEEMDFDSVDNNTIDIDKKLNNDKTTYHVAKKPAMHVTIGSIIKDFNADWFLWYLNDFLHKNSFITNPIDSGLTENTIIPVYKQARLHLPPLLEAKSENCVDIVHATKAESVATSLFFCHNVSA